MKVVWTATALGHLTGIYEYIAADSTTYARRMVDRVTRRTEQLATFPESGGKVLEYDNPAIRELIEGPYRIIYQTRPDRVEVVAVVHGARQLPDAL